MRAEAPRANPKSTTSVAVFGLCAALFLSLAAPTASAEALTNQAQMTLMRSHYIEIDQEQAMGRELMFSPGGAPLPVYLNRHGGTYTPGWNNSATNTSSIVDATSTITPYPGSDASWNEVLTCVQEQFANYNVYITDLEPTEGAYIEAVVAGSPDQIGMPWGVGGVAPYDPYTCEVIDQAIVYAFADVYIGGWGGERALCETTTQEIAHAMTLDHALLCEDPMTYLDGCGEKWFQNVDSVCGEYEERDCSCQRPTQNSVQLLTELIGPNDGNPPPPPPEDMGPPTLTLLSPANDSVFEAETEVEVTAEISDDLGLVSVQMYWEFNDILLGCPGEGGGWSCTQFGDTYTWRITPGLGQRNLQVRARDVAGNEVESEMVTIWLTEDGQAPPEDLYPPEVTIVSPAKNAEVQQNGPVQVVVTASDDVGITQIGLNWFYSERSFPCPMNSQTVTCEVDGSTYIWELNVGEGTRTFSVSAVDFVGNVVTTEERTVTLVQNPPAKPDNDSFEPNDTWDQATEISCGDSIDAVAFFEDDDWFKVAVPEGQGVRFTASGEVAEQLTLVVSNGPFSASELGRSGDGAHRVELVPPTVKEGEEAAEESEIGVRVIAAPGTHGAYTLAAECVDADELLNPGGDENLPGDPEMPPLDLAGCSSLAVPGTHAGGGLVALGLMSVFLMRRRRTEVRGRSS